MRVYIPADYTRGKAYEGRGSIRQVIGDRAAEILSDVYRREYLLIPTAREALDRARRAPIIAAVRSGDMTATDAAKALSTSRPYMSYLVNQRDEWDLPLHGEDRARVLQALGRRDPRDHPEDWEDVPCRGRRGLPGQMDLFGDED